MMAKLKAFEMNSRRELKVREMVAAYSQAEAAALLETSPSTVGMIAWRVPEDHPLYALAVSRPGVVFWANQGGTAEEQSFVPKDQFVRRPVRKLF